MKAMSKQELADCAGVTLKTLRGWCKSFEKELREMGMTPGSLCTVGIPLPLAPKVEPAKLIVFIFDKYKKS